MFLNNKSKKRKKDIKLKIYKKNKERKQKSPYHRSSMLYIMYIIKSPVKRFL